MSFDPNIPTPHTRVKSAEMRSQFNALKALIDALTAQMTAQALQFTSLASQVTGQQVFITALQGQIAGLNTAIAALANIVPIGAVLPWFKDAAGVPALPANFVECNGQVLSDAESPLDGTTIEDLNNAQVFLRGAAASGGTGGNVLHAHDVDLTGTSAGDPGSSGGNTVPGNFYTTTSASSLPPYVEAVFVMRVK